MDERSKGQRDDGLKANQFSEVTRGVSDLARNLPVHLVFAYLQHRSRRQGKPQLPEMLIIGDRFAATAC
ncbi:MAG: hypothetical protein ACO3XN_10990, partial [Chthoniobacterales bacterium]